MNTLQELCNFLAQLLNNNEIIDKCPNGLQIEGKKEIKSVATAVSASHATIEEAVKQNVDALIVHHGIFWSGDSMVIKGAKKNKIKLLLDNEISLIAYHLPLDAHTEVGNNWRAAKEMGWQNLQPFGLGVKGTFKPISREQFKTQLENYYKHPAHCALGGKEIVSSAGLISGGAYREISQAIGLDCFITGNFDEPVWHTAHEEKINFFALGHSATEKVGPRALAKIIQEKCGIKSEFIDIENPF